VEAAGTVVDGTVEQRWRKTVATLGLEAPWEDADANP
jgi:flagellar assembly protein FliH